MKGEFPDLRVGVIGAGTISHRHIEAWKLLGAKVLVQSPSRARTVAQSYGITSVEGLQELITQVDVVDICSPTDTHAQIALAAIAASRPVICEKPLARSVFDAKQLVQAARAAEVQLLPAQVVRFFNPYPEIHALLQAGKIGVVQTLRLSRAGTSPAVAGSWFADIARSGGIVFDLMIHDLDIARWFAGEVTTVFAQQFPASHDGQLPRNVGAQIAMTHAGGAISQLQAAWGAAEIPFRTSVDVFGESGLLSHDTARSSAVTMTGTGLRERTPSDVAGSPAVDPYLAQLHEFAVALTGGAPARVSAEDGWAAVTLAEAALESITTGQPVDVGRPDSAPRAERDQRS